MRVGPFACEHSGAPGQAAMARRASPASTMNPSARAAAAMRAACSSDRVGAKIARQGVSRNSVRAFFRDGVGEVGEVSREKSPEWRGEAGEEIFADLTRAEQIG